MGSLKTEEGRHVHFEHHKATGKRSGVPVMLIHGWGSSSRVWDTTLVALQDAGHDVVAFDQRGCGQSDKDFEKVSIEAAAADAVAIADTLGLRRIAVNGWSLGGTIAVETARVLGDRCAGVVLTSGASPRFTQADGFPHGNPPGSTAETVQALRADRASFLYELSKAVYAQPQSDAVINWTWSLFMQAAPCADLALQQLDTVDQREILAGLQAPLLSIVGGKDPVTVPDIGRQAAEYAANGRLEEFADSGHAAFIEEGPRYRKVLLEFLASLK